MIVWKGSYYTETTTDVIGTVPILSVLVPLGVNTPSKAWIFVSLYTTVEYTSALQNIYLSF